MATNVNKISDLQLGAALNEILYRLCAIYDSGLPEDVRLVVRDCIVDIHDVSVKVIDSSISSRK